MIDFFSQKVKRILKKNSNLLAKNLIDITFPLAQRRAKVATHNHIPFHILVSSFDPAYSIFSIKHRVLHVDS